MDELPGSDVSPAAAYFVLRRAIGLMGMLLPFVLILGKILIEGPDLPDSISAYYYTAMRNVLVGSLCAIGVFLLFYRYKKIDIFATVLAGVCAIGIALFPMTPERCPTQIQEIIGRVHYAFAALFFLTLAAISLFLFTKTYPENTKKPGRPREYFLFLVDSIADKSRLGTRKILRNRVYRICGCTIVACVVLLAVVMRPRFKTHVNHFNLIFWLETIAVVAFSISWLTKGETLKPLRDRESDLLTSVRTES